MRDMPLWELIFCFISGALITLIIPGTTQLPLLRQGLKNPRLVNFSFKFLTLKHDCNKIILHKDILNTFFFADD